MFWPMQLAKEVREQRSEMLRQTPSGVHFFDGQVAETSALVLPSFDGSTKLRDLVVAQLENEYVQREAEKEGIINRPSIQPFTSHQVAPGPSQTACRGLFKSQMKMSWPIPGQCSGDQPSRQLSCENLCKLTGV